MSEREPPDLPALRAWAAGAALRGRTAWPALDVSEDELIRIAALHGAEAAPNARGLDLDALDVAELYLAAACARGDPAGLHALRGRYFAPVARALRRMGVAAAQHDEAWQILCERLLVSEAGARPRIVRYAGTGKLTGLMTVAVTRLALNWRDKDSRQVSGDDWLRWLPACGPDPEVQAMKKRHAIELKQELEAAVAALNTRERMVLRLHLVERLGIDDIAAICSVHRATAARIAARAKDRLAEQLRARLMSRWNVAHAELPALKALVDSHIDLSLSRLLSRSGRISAGAIASGR